MADTKITALTADASPTSDDLVPTVNDPGGTPANRKVTAGNLITKAHGLSDGLVKVATGAMAVATAGTDYSTPSSTDTLTNKTFDANGTGNSLSNVEVADLAGSAVVTAAEGLASSDNDTSLPTTAAVIDGLDTKQPLDSDLTTIAGLTATTNNIIQSSASAWASRTPTQVTATLDNMVGDSGSGGTKGLVPAPAAGDAAANKYLKADGNWTAVSSGGQTTYDAIVATSGGTHTTLSSALAAASAGWRILILDGDTLSGAVSSALNNLEIVGSGNGGAVLALGSNVLTLSGTGVVLRNLSISASTGGMVMSGANFRIHGCYFSWTSNSTTNRKISMAGDGGEMHDSIVVATSATSSSENAIRVLGTNNKIVNCRFDISSADHGTSNLAYIRFAGIGGVASGNTFVVTTPTAGMYLLNSTSEGNVFDSNTVYCTDTADFNAICAGTGGTDGVISNNRIRGNQGSIYVNSARVVVEGNNVYCSGTPTATGAILLDSSSSNCIVSDNLLMNNGSSGGTGVYVNGGAGHKVTDNRIITFACGIDNASGTNITISSNSVTDFAGSNYGIHCQAGPANITGNTLIGSTTTGRGIRSLSANSTVSGNTCINGQYGIDIATGTNQTVTGNSCYPSATGGYGVSVGGNYCTVTGNNFRGVGTTGGRGVYIDANYVTVTGNNIYNFQRGIQANAPSYSSITANQVDTTTAAGLDINTADYCVWSNNVLRNCTVGILYSTHNRSNTVINNQGAGINAIHETKIVWMKNTTGGALAAGDVVVWKAVAAGNEITTTTTAGDDKVFGVCTEAITDTNFGPVQVLGKTTLLKADGTTDIAVGDFLTTFTTAKIAAKATAGDQAFAIALEAYTTDDSNGVIDALLIEPRMI